MDATTANDQQQAAMDFRQRMLKGEYASLFDAQLRVILADAGSGLSLVDELGAVRVALARLLAEETDPRHLALGVSRLVAASARLVRVRRDDDSPESLNEIFALANRLARHFLEQRLGGAWESDEGLVAALGPFNIGEGFILAANPETPGTRENPYEPRLAADGLPEFGDNIFDDPAWQDELHLYYPDLS